MTKLWMLHNIGIKEYFYGKNCVVTGAASGIGLALTEALLQTGVVVFYGRAVAVARFYRTSTRGVRSVQSHLHWSNGVCHCALGNTKAVIACFTNVMRSCGGHDSDISIR